MGFSGNLRVFPAPPADGEPDWREIAEGLAWALAAHNHNLPPCQNCDDAARRYNEAWDYAEQYGEASDEAER